MKNSVLFSLILVVAIVGGAGLVYFESSLPDNDLMNQNVNSQLLKVDMLDANINELALRSRANLDANYDMLVRSTVAMERTVSDLSNGYFKKEDIGGTLLDTRFDRFKASMEIKLDQVENFKSSNSVLRNSERYIPIVGAQLTNLSRANDLPKISDLYKQVVIDMLEFTKQGNSKPVEVVADLSNQVLATESAMPQESSIKVLEYANHITTAIDAKEKADQYLIKILNSAANDQVGEISNAWNLRQSENSGSRETLRSYKIGYLLLLLALVGVLIYRLRQSYANLNREAKTKSKEAKAAQDELQVAELQLVQSEKMALFGRLAAGARHEINAPLGSVSSSLESIRSRFGRLAPVLLNAEAISKTVADQSRDKNAINRLLKEQIVSFRKASIDNGPQNITTLLNDASDELQKIKGVVDSLPSMGGARDEVAEDVG